jgi:hypothetical protein
MGRWFQDGKEGGTKGLRKSNSFNMGFERKSNSTIKEKLKRQKLLCTLFWEE